MELEQGSFRDRDNQVFYADGNVYRALSNVAFDNWQKLVEEPFFKKLAATGKVIGTEIAGDVTLPDNGWAGALKHQRIPYVSYPYEWTFGMLRDAALLHLEILERAIPNGWTLKDATAYNVQWIGHKPTFIDTTSFEPYEAGTPWLGYRQFCMMFLNPLLLKAHKDIDYIPLLRSNLEGIEPTEAAKYFGKSEVFRRGVLFNVLMHAKVQRRAEMSEIKGDDSGGTSRPTRHTEAMVMGTLQSMRRVVESLSIGKQVTTWSHYDESHSYVEDTFVDKKHFVEKHSSSQHWPMVWDIGCNTGTFSKICSPFADNVCAMDGDAMAIETLYKRLQTEDFKNILPLVINLANVSPAQGWRGQERTTIEARGKPDLLVCLALIHHMVISANIPMRSYIEWIRSLDCSVIIEFVGPDDEMTQQLLKNKVNQYEDFNEGNFLSILQEMFTVEDTMPLKSGVRKIFYLKPKA